MYVYGKLGIIVVVKVGVIIVEYVFFVDEECIDLIKEKGIIYVVMCCIVKELFEIGGKGMFKKIWEKVKFCGSNYDKVYKLVVVVGCIIVFGMDFLLGYLKMVMEIEYVVEVGLLNLEVFKVVMVNGVLIVKG